MAVNNTAKAYSKMEFPLAMQRQDAFSLDKTEVWASLAEAQAYAQTDPTAYVGQKIAVVVDGVAKQYHIKNAAGDLEELGAGSGTNYDVATDDEVSSMLDEVFPE
jgi:hypothetical protein